MAQTTIEWTATRRADGTLAPGYTFNPWIGCTKVSDGCKNCYAQTEDGRRKWTPEGWGKGKPRKRTSEANWKMPLKWNREARQAGERRKVFCASLADVFDEEVPDAWRDDLFALVAATPSLDWLVLSKRPQKMLAYMTDKSFAERIHNINFERRDGALWKHLDAAAYIRLGRDDAYDLPLANVWLGTSVEDQDAADERIPHLLQVPAVVRFLSCEPLLGPVDLRLWEFEIAGAQPAPTGLVYEIPERRSMLHWVIAGGESGLKARPCHPNWARSLRDQCTAASVPFFWKQWGEWLETICTAGGHLGDDMRRDVVRHVCADRENDGHFRRGDVYMRRVGKKNAGRLLDSRTWDEMPQVLEAVTS